MFNILLCDDELRLYELESLRVGLNLAKFGTRKTLESHSKSIIQMDRSHQSTLLPLCYMISYIRYMLSPERLSAHCLLLWRKKESSLQFYELLSICLFNGINGHAASGTGLQCLINFYGRYPHINK
ncbi:uncharacterized protein LOC126628624 isoform X1 [Malus sylvestris]|uniref:uncharacterized protein LOC126628624 isoform X1 n=1 Tax=Malus sylvestris TaxID=3752 RepID=UPI0021ABE2FB|nr:uncharacterized protein LOC126628624 isoform X1 [Malus sylvestris]